MTHGSLFSGIGGFDLAAEWMGWENKFHCEWNEFGQKVLKYYWPESELFTDITKSDFTKYANQIDVLTGGFPCQPYSTAGKRLGKEDERHLWPEMLRAIREVKPTWVVGENVRGLVSWNGGLVFHEVQNDLENQGYEVQPFLIPAASVNAPHRRDRIWFVAYNNSFIWRKGRKFEPTEQSRYGKSNEESNSTNDWFVADSNNQGGSNEFKQVQRENAEISKWNNNAESSDSNKFNNTSNTNSEMLEYGNRKGEAPKRAIKEKRIESFNGTRKWETFPSVSPICNGDDGLSDRLDSITFSKWRRESIKAGGNAIVPQVVYQIFKAIEQYEQNRTISATNR
jgi:DNA (cytosine-5)-methyltransferase 1